MTQIDRLSLPFSNGEIKVPDAGNILVLRASPSPAYALFDCDRTFCRQAFFPTSQRLETAGFALNRPWPDVFQIAIVHITRSRDETRALIAKAWQMLSSGGILIVDGNKTDGIESHLKAVKKLLPISGTISKSHGKVFWLTKTETPAIFNNWQKALEPHKNKDGYFTRAGGFSTDKIDKGSAQLVPLLAGNLKGTGADLGAGWGFLAEQALGNNSAIETLDLIEADRHALDCARLNLNDLRAQYHWADATNYTPATPLDFVITNPPFHQSRKADPGLGQRFIAAAAKMLKPTGSLFLVANRQLAYEATLAENFRHVELLDQSSQFKCIWARKPKH